MQIYRSTAQKRILLAEDDDFSIHRKVECVQFINALNSHFLHPRNEKVFSIFHACCNREKKTSFSSTSFKLNKSIKLFLS
jgi:hypothetical protein